MAAPLRTIHYPTETERNSLRGVGQCRCMIHNYLITPPLFPSLPIYIRQCVNNIRPYSWVSNDEKKGFTRMTMMMTTTSKCVNSNSRPNLSSPLVCVLLFFSSFFIFCYSSRRMLPVVTVTWPWKSYTLSNVAPSRNFWKLERFCWKVDYDLDSLVLIGLIFCFYPRK